MYVFIIIILTILCIILLGSFHFSNKVIYPQTLSHAETYEKESEAGRLDETYLESLYKEEVVIKSSYGYNLYGLYFPIKGAKNTIILCHGITYTLYGCIKYIKIFRKRGYNILIYDHRNHGKSGGNTTTYGFYEKYDLKTCSDWLFETYGNDIKIGILGESMGAATALQNSAIDPRISFYIADCPYDSLYGILTFRLKVDYRLPAFPLIYICSFMNKLRTGVYFGEVSPVASIKEVATPIFFIHGLQDDYIPYDMTKKMYNIKKGAKKLYLAPNAGHVKAYWHNQEEYDALVGEFLMEIGF
ncbi:MAG: alpha/beta hydrolase [Clostridiaceae bacterium]|nr:alpha/beta hydrolase [Clostridiaceae bacterium]